jgi:hypothetical protein
MKKAAVVFLTAAIAWAGCSKIGDDILDPFNNNEGNVVTSTVHYEATGDNTVSIADAEPEEDLIANTEFDRTISIVFSSTGAATVSGDEKGIVTVDGNHVTADNTTTKEKVMYKLSGSSSDGFFKVYSKNKQAFVLDGLSLTNPSGAAINNQGKKRCFVVVNGTNSLADGASYTATPSDEDEKAAFFSEGQLIFSGEGTLTVTAKGKSGIASDDYVHFVASPTIKVSSTAGHGIRGKDAVIVSDGTLSVSASAAMKKGVTSDSLVVFNGGVTTIQVSGGTAYDDEDQEYKASAGIKADYRFVMNAGSLTVTNSGQGGKGISGDGEGYFQGGSVKVTVTGSNFGNSSSSDDNSKSAKGIKFDGNLYITAGDIVATAANHEAIESKGILEISGGTVYAQSKDDAINSAGDMAILGGCICAYSTGNDGLDANGDLYLEGGTVYAIGSGGAEVALDANTEEGHTLYVNGGNLVAIGGLERGAVLYQACYTATSWSKDTWYSFTIGTNTFAFKTPSSAGSGLVVSGASQPAIMSGVTVSSGTSLNGMLTLGGSVSGGKEVELSAYSSGNGMGGPGGGGPGGWPGGR